MWHRGVAYLFGYTFFQIKTLCITPGHHTVSITSVQIDIWSCGSTFDDYNLQCLR